MTAQEREEQLHKLKSQAETLRQTIKLGDASLVNGVYEDNEMKWMCIRCPYSQRCSELRNHDGSIVGAVAAYCLIVQKINPGTVANVVLHIRIH
jgi:hypothetical protein